MKTGDYCCGAASLFADDEFGPTYVAGLPSWTELSTDQSNELFDRMGRFLNDVFSYGRQLGLKTCVGTETPLVIPTPVKKRLEAAGKDPADPAVVQELYEGVFRRIARTHPVDYYWFWTPEGWTWRGATQEQVDATLADFRAAIAASEKVRAPFTLATCGWVLGPPQEPSLFDNVLPKEMPMSCINRQVGHAPVEPGFANVSGRPKWAIPWLEDDPSLTSPQLWVGRMRQDAADSLAYGCTGLLGIHWRTRILGPNVSALAKAAWDQSGWKASAGQTAEEDAQAEGPVEGRIARFPNQPMAGTDRQPLYQTVRYGMSAYLLDVPNGSYIVTLRFCEPAKNGPGQRVFGVKVEGRLVADHLDLFKLVGKDRAHDVTVRDVEVRDGRLAIDFLPEVEYPCIAAIEVEGPAVRKINCGGPAWQDYQADWPRTGETVTSKRSLPCGDFYADWAQSQFGPEVAGPAAELFERIDGRLPRPSDWVGGPGGVKPDARPWDEVRKEYAFVDELAALRDKVRGAGNLERFDYWLDQFQYMRAIGRFNCTLGRINAAMAKAKAEPDAAARRRLAEETVLPIRRELIEQLAEVQKYLLASVSTYGGLGNVTNWQQHVMPAVVTAPGRELAEMLDRPLPDDCQPSKEYDGPWRLFVPTVRTGLVKGERLELTAIVLGPLPESVSVFWRPIGGEAFTATPMKHAGRGVYQVTLPPEATRADLEYYVQAADTPWAAFPPTAPHLNQTVVVVEP